MQSLAQSRDGIFQFDESDVEEELNLAALSLERQPSYYLEEGLQEMEVDAEIVIDAPGTFCSN